MKTHLALISSILFLSGCAGTVSERIVTKGPLICEAGEICPELAIGWKEQTREGFKISAEITNANAYHIQQFEFLVDGQPYTYSTIEPTQYNTQGALTTSSNFIRVPVSFLNSFRDGQQIELKLMTDKGDILRPIKKANGEKSSAYLTFLKGYAGITPKQ